MNSSKKCNEAVNSNKNKLNSKIIFHFSFFISDFFNDQYSTVLLHHPQFSKTTPPEQQS